MRVWRVRAGTGTRRECRHSPRAWPFFAICIIYRAFLGEHTARRSKGGVFNKRRIYTPDLYGRFNLAERFTSIESLEFSISCTFFARRL